MADVRDFRWRRGFAGCAIVDRHGHARTRLVRSGGGGRRLAGGTGGAARGAGGVEPRRRRRAHHVGRGRGTSRSLGRPPARLRGRAGLRRGAGRAGRQWPPAAGLGGELCGSAIRAAGRGCAIDADADRACLDASARRDTLRPGHRARARPHRRWRHVSGQLHVPDDGGLPGRPMDVVPCVCPAGARPVCRVHRHRVGRGHEPVARAVPRAPRRSPAGTADEGHDTPWPLAGPRTIASRRRSPPARRPAPRT